MIVRLPDQRHVLPLMLARRPGLPLRLDDFHVPRPQRRPFTLRRRLIMTGSESTAHGIVANVMSFLLAPFRRR
jgi:hypothetical protein